MTTRNTTEGNPSPNKLLAWVSLLAAVSTTIFFLAPLRTLPADVTAMKSDVSDVKQTQAVFGETLRTLADVAKESREMRRDLDRSSIEGQARDAALDREIDGVKHRLDVIEVRKP